MKHFLPHTATRKVAFGPHQEAVAVMALAKPSESSTKSSRVYVIAVYDKIHSKLKNIMKEQSVYRLTVI